MPDTPVSVGKLLVGRVGRHAPPPSRRLLDQGWQLCAGPAGARVPPAADAAWLDIGEPLPVAAALARLGLWSIDGPARDFDAETWFYRLRFDLPDGEHAAPWRLGLDGLATLAEVQLNGEVLLASRNMFRRHELALEGLRARDNELLLRFDPLSTALGARRPRPRWRVPMLAHQQLRWWRTTLLGRTPGWSPPAAVVGPWQPIWLQRAEDTALASCTLATSIEQRPGGEVGGLAVTLSWSGAEPDSCRAVLRRGAWSTSVALSAGAGAWAGRLEVQPLVRWWPHTHGEPAVYELELETVLAGVVRHWSLGPVGFRELTVDHHGGGFDIHVNGTRVFCRGACWVPLDSLRMHAGAADYAAVIARVRAAGMNMLRVPGTMVYESPAFFDACDAAGVLVWQDLMFASMDYPGEDAVFLGEVQAELAQQLPEWQARACLAVVCGNSEVDQQAAMWGTDAAQWQPALFHQTVPALVARHLDGVPYWPSSAHGGDFPFSPDTGTTSYYGVGAYRRPIDDARASGLRFASECLAFANVPGDATLARVPGLGVGLQVHHPGWKARVPRDLGAGWDFDDVRDHYAGLWSGEPSGPLRASDPARHLALARAASGEVMAAAFAHWRRADSVCGGALVWTLRDLWAGAGWGLLDDECQPKPAFHALARACQPLHLALVDEGLGGLAVHLDNEGAEPVEAELELVLWQQGDVEVARVRLPLRLAARARSRHGVVALVGRFIDAGWAYRFGPRPVTFALATLRGLGGRGPISACWFAPGRLAGGVADIGLMARVETVEGAGASRRRVRLATRGAAIGVFFDAQGWRASDEFFHLAPGGERTVDFEPAEAPGADAPPPPWRVMVGALNSDRWTAVPPGGSA